MVKKVSWQRLAYILGVTAVVVGPMLMLYAHLAHGLFQTYQQQGATTSATILDKDKRYNPRLSYRVKVSFWTASLLEGGELIFAELGSIMASDWESLQVDDQVEVVYLPSNPRQVILRARLDPVNFPPAERYEFGLAVLIAGLLLTLATRRQTFA